MTEHQELGRVTNIINALTFELAQTNEDLLETLAKFGVQPHDHHYQRTEARLKRVRTLIKKS